MMMGIMTVVTAEL